MKRAVGSKRGGFVRDDGARSKVSQKSQMSLDLLARQLPETSGIRKMASARLRPWRCPTIPVWQTCSLPVRLASRVQRRQNGGETKRRGDKEKEVEERAIFISDQRVGGCWDGITPRIKS